MQLALSKKEVETVLLEWAEQKWPGQFNAVELDTRYGGADGATFSKETPEKGAE